MTPLLYSAANVLNFSNATNQSSKWTMKSEPERRINAISQRTRDLDPTVSLT